MVTLLGHIIPAVVTTMVTRPTNYATLAGHVVEITPDDSSSTLVGSAVPTGIIESNLIAFNGLVNILDYVSLVPGGVRPLNASTVRILGHINIIVVSSNVLQNSTAWELISTWDRLSNFSSFIQVKLKMKHGGIMFVYSLADQYDE